MPSTEAAQQAVKQAQALVDSQDVTAAKEVLRSLTSGLAGLPDAALEQVAGSAEGAVAPLQQALQGAVDSAAGKMDLPAHWGRMAVQDAVDSALQAVQSLPLGVSLESGADGVWEAATAAAGALPYLDAGSAIQGAAQQLSSAVDALGGLPEGLTDDASSLLDDLRGVLSSLPLQTLTAQLIPAGGVPGDWLGSEVVKRLADRLQVLLINGSWAGVGLPELALTAAGLFLAISASSRMPSAFANAQSDPEGTAEKELGYEYDPERLAEYFARRPVLVAKRAAEVAGECAAFGLALLGDMARPGGLAANEQERAVQLRFAIERLGPAYVKVAQALSTRVDLLTPAYFEQIQLLQDRVPPFPTTVAREAMTRAFGKPVEDVFSYLSAEPVAAASLGQVYRATLVPELGGGDVAVKVQRPGVLGQVSLDLFLMRKLAQVATPRMRSDWVAITDTWAVRFLHEMDYTREADNAERFARDMAGIKGIVVPAPVREARLTSHCVLTSVWIEGEKLCESQADDVRTLCDTLLSAYLVALLDTGFLHADPHPGNLLRTPDGRIAVLDYGLMTEITEAQRWALLEYIAHLSTQDWQGLAKDLQTLGFIPEYVNPEDAGLVEPLGRVMSQLTGGGGAAKVNIDRVMVDLEALGTKYPFRVPAFFALILRAFSVIEGIALGVDPDYAIVTECFPYLSRRLLSDDSPRARAILRDILYGGNERLNIDRMVRLADGFSAYSTDGLMEGAAAPPRLAMPSMSSMAGQLPAGGLAGRMSALSRSGGQALGLPGAAASSSSQSTTASPAAPRPAPARRAPAAPQPLIAPAARDALVLVFGRPNSYVQELLVEEAAAAVDALSWSAVGSLVLGLAGGNPNAALGAVSSSSSSTPLPTMPFQSLPFPGVPLLPLPILPLPLLPPDAAARLQPYVELTDADKEALRVVRGIAQLVSKAQALAAAAPAPVAVAAPAGVPPGLAAVSWVRSVGTEMAPLLPQLTPGLVSMSQRLNQVLWERAQRRIQTLSTSLQGTARTPPSASTTATVDVPASSSSTPGAAPAPRSATAPAPATSGGKGSRPGPVMRSLGGDAGGRMQGGSSEAAARARAAATKAGQKGSTWSADDLLGGGARVRSTAESTWM